MSTYLFQNARCHARALPAAAILALALLAPRLSAWGAGYEKAITWSGRYAGMGSAAVSTVAGAESLFFNPAGLAGRRGAELSLNLSPTITRLDGALPGSSAGQVWADGNPKTVPIAGTLASYGLTERWGIGAGYYVTGGLRSAFEGVDYSGAFPAARFRPTVEADLAITEVGLGTAYHLARGLKVGGSWRIVNVNANFSSVRVIEQGGIPVALVNVHFTDMKDTSYTGFRVGTQYQAPDERWGLGASWRTRVRFTAEGRASGVVDSVIAPAVAPLGSTPASVSNILPQQFAIGAYYRDTPEMMFVGEYAWTEYSDNSVLDITGTLGGSPLPDIVQNWGNMSNVRFGMEYTGWGSWALRAGYVFTSRVTPSDFARATSSVPGEGHTVTFGLGRKWSSKLDWNLALEYSFANGYGSNAADGITTAGFNSHALAAHTGASYRF